MTANKIRGIFAVEGFVEIRGEEEASSTAANALVVRISVEDGIQPLTVKGGHVFDVILVFQPTLDFEGYDAGFHHIFYIICPAHIFQRKQMFVVYQRFTIAVLQVETGATDLGTLSPIAASARHHPANITLSAVAHAQRSVHEGFKLNIRLMMNLLNGLQVGFTR